MWLGEHFTDELSWDRENRNLPRSYMQMQAHANWYLNAQTADSFCECETDKTDTDKTDVT